MFKSLVSRLLCLLPALGLIGCQSPCGTGWSFQVGKPATVQAQTILGPSVTTFAGQGVAAGPVGDHLFLTPQVAPSSSPALLPMPQRSLSLTSQAARTSCTLDEVCQMLTRMQGQLDRLAAGKPMPGGEE